MSKNIDNSNQETLIKFPCDFFIKVIGVMNENFTQSIITEIYNIDQSFDATKVDIQSSQHGKYISLTCKVFVTSKSQLDLIYSKLSSHPDTKFVI
ncbi:MAG: DUF493 domain-containing protein [Proteobacteria bacterium]|nr:DUF493 domain-containing protein [Pseudomonadota bacterium]